MNRARAALFAWLLALCAMLLPGAATAQRDDTRAPVAQDAVDTAPGLAPLRAPPVPADYVREQHGALSISYPRAIASQLRNALAHAEPDARTVGAQLGLTTLPPLDVRLVPDPDTMRRLAPEEAPPPAYAVGVAYPSIGLALVSASEPRTWQAPDMRQVLRHELSHVLLAAATNHAAIPRWFSEGVAVHQAGEHSYERFRTLAVASFTRGIIAFDDLDAAFSQGPDRVDVAYAESADFVAYLTRSGDTFRFTVLLQHLRQGLPLDRAFRETYRASLTQLEADWRDDARSRFLAAPLWAGTSLVWLLSMFAMVVAYLRRRTRARATLARWEAEEKRVQQQPPRFVVVTPGVLSGIYGDAESEKPAPTTDDDSKPPHTLN